MGYQRFFDEEPTRVSEVACVNDGTSLYSYVLSLTTTVLSVDDVAPCIYRAFLEGMDGSLTVALTTSRTTGSVPLPTPNAWSPTPTTPTKSSDPVAIFPGNQVVRVRVMAGLQTLNVRMISGTGMLYLVPVLDGL
jgi:hypothetical protein